MKSTSGRIIDIRIFILANLTCNIFKCTKNKLLN